MQMELNLPDLRPNDIHVTFQAPKDDHLPIQSAVIKTESGSEELIYSGVLTGNGFCLAVSSERNSFPAQFRRPLDQRSNEISGYQARSCIFFHSADPLSNFYSVDAPAGGTLYISNRSTRSLRFRMPDGSLYRVCAGYTEALEPSNTLALLGPLKVLLEIGSTLDIRLSGVRVLERGRWHKGQISFCCGSFVDSYYLRLWHRDDCLGVLHAYSGYFLDRPRLGVLDLNSYGQAEWYARNAGDAPLALQREWTPGPPVTIPADRRVHKLPEKLFR